MITLKNVILRRGAKVVLDKASVTLNPGEKVGLVGRNGALLRAVCDEFWLVWRGGVGPFDGDLDDYQRYLLEEAKRSREAAAKP